MEQSHILRDLIVLFGAALVVVLVLRRLRLPTIAGFLVAGALIGPSGFGWIRDAHEIESLAEIGVDRRGSGSAGGRPEGVTVSGP